MSVFHQMKIARRLTLSTLHTHALTRTHSRTPFRFLLVVESLRVYCACIRIWLMNVLCDLPIWKSVANAFCTYARTIHSAPSHCEEIARASTRYNALFAGKKRAMKYMFNIYFDHINGFSYRYRVPFCHGDTHTQFFFLCVSYIEHTLRYSHGMLNGKSEEV